MCMYEPEDSSLKATALHITELTLAGIFLAECLLRILASGEDQNYLHFPSADAPEDFEIMDLQLESFFGT